MKTYLFVKEVPDFDKLGHRIVFKEFIKIIASSKNEAQEKLEEQLRPRYPKRKNYEQELKRWKITEEDIF
jgi:hypothetical protein